jgi:hypothetical protein
MKQDIRQSDLPFNCTPLGSWAALHNRKRYDRAAKKLAIRTGMPLPIAQVFAALNGLGDRRGR